MDLIEQKKINSTQFKRHPWEIVRFKILLFLLKKIPGKNFIVDVGSGDGFVASKLSKKFPKSEIAAVDINYTEDFVRTDKTPNLVFLKSLDALPVNTSINTVLLMDVLEHIEKPERLLNALRQLKSFTTQTRVIVTVPAFQFLFSEHDVFLKHFRRYNRKQLKQLLCNEGFTISFNGYFFSTLFFTRLLQKIFGRKINNGLHNWEGSSLLTAIITALLWSDFKISWYLSRIGIHLPGLSCYCVCYLQPS